MKRPPPPVRDPAERGFRLVLFVGTALRLAFAATAGLKYEEAYYWNYSQHPELSYFDHPPMVAWLIGAFTSLGGSSELWVRLPAILLFVGSMVLVHRVARDLFDSRVALGAVVLMNLLPVFEWYSILILPDAPLLFFWCLGLFAGHRLVQSGDPRWWWVIGVATGFGCVSKYPAALIPFGTMLYLGFQRRWKELLSPHMFGAAVLAAVLFTPVILWNAENDWASLAYQGASRMGEATSFQDRFGGSALNQLLMLGPFGIFAIAWAVIAGLRRWREPRFLFLLCWCVPFLGLMLFVATRRLVQMNWPIPGYVAAVVLLAALWLERDTLWRRVAAAIVLIPAGLIAFLPWLATFFEIGALNRADDFNGWVPMAQRVQELQAAMPQPSRTFLAGHGYQAASEIAYYTRQPHRTLSNNVLGDEAKGYDFWEEPAAFQGWDAIYMVYEEPTSGGDWRQRVRLDPARLEKAFARVDGTDSLIVFRGGKPLRRYVFYRCFDYRGPAPED